MTFIPQYPDYTLSSFTGLTWQHWVDAGNLLLDGVFRHIPELDSPLCLPRHETAITYPQPGHPRWRYRSEIFEGVARTLLIAAPLLAHFPDLHSRGIPLAEYYRRAILRLCDPASDEFIGNIDEIVAESGDNPYQMTCECASLVIAMRTAAATLWEPFSQGERDGIAMVLSGWAHRRTHPHNWRLFNISILAFLCDHGYPIDEAIYTDHLRVVRSFDAGNGWYRDGTLFDYYSVWAFQFYAPMWAQTTGYRTMPEMAAAIEASSNELLRTYDRIFDRQGHQIMWGRSNIYRFAASAPFGAAFLLKQPQIRPGVARRIMSGNLLQFLGNPAFWVEGLPSLGFYGPFTPLIQPYSCAASPFWFGNAYHAVALGRHHPLWATKEEEGSWGSVDSRDPVETELPGPGIMVTQYPLSGASEIRTAKVAITLKSGLLANYSRLAFHSAFPWQADTSTGQPAMQYRFTTNDRSWMPNLILYGGRRAGVLHRRMAFNFEGVFGELPTIDLADFSLPEGLVRCDRLRVTQPNASLSLAHYALPITDGAVAIEKRTVGPGHQAIIAASGGRQLAFVAIHGWQSLDAQRERGLHPESSESVLLIASSQRTQRYGEEPLRISLLLHRMNDQPWKDSELWPFAAMHIHSTSPNGSAPSVEFKLANGSIQLVEYAQSEGALSI